MKGKKFRVVKILVFLGLVQVCVFAATAATIGFGETVSGTISTSGEKDSYTFTASAGDTVYTRMVSSWQQYPQIQLYDPYGILIADANGISWRISNTSHLESTGTYTIIVGDGHIGSATGTYGLFLQRTNNSGNASPIAFGETKNGTISTTGEMISYNFTASAGDTVYTRMVSSWQQDPQIQMFAPNGTRIADANGLSWMNSNTSRLDSTGTYTIIVGDGYIGSATGTYGLFLQRTNNSGNAPPIAFGETKNGAISTMGEMKSYTFSAWNGDRISVHMTSSWQQDPHIQVFAPNGTRIAEANGLSWANSNTSLLESSGTYTIVIGDGHIGSDTGTYGLSLQFLGTLRTIANFSANITSGLPPLAVQFTDSSTNSPSAWSWDFGDGNSSTRQNPSNSYGGPGLYSVTLTATNAYGSNSTIKTQYILVTANRTTKIGIFRPATGYWYFDYNLDGTVDKSFRYGSSTDQIIKGNWTGTGTDGIAIFRPSTGYWYFDNNLDGIVNNSFRYGSSTDRITAGDWNGDGSDGIAIFRPSTGYWYFDYNLDGIVNNSFRYGSSTDRITAGDWNGDGSDGIAIFRPATGYWYFDNNLDGIVDTSFRFGGSSDQIIVGKWQGTTQGIAIFRPSTGYWYFDFNLDGTVDKSFRFGSGTDQIIAGDWQGTGADGIAIFRPSSGYWYFDYNLDGTVDKSFRYGGNTDQIIGGKWA